MVLLNLKDASLLTVCGPDAALSEPENTQAEVGYAILRVRREREFIGPDAFRLARAPLKKEERGRWLR